LRAVFFLLALSEDAGRDKGARDPEMQDQIDRLWQRLDGEKRLAFLSPELKEHADNFESQLVEATGRRRSAEAASFDSARASKPRGWFVMANLACAALLAFWVCLSHGRSSLVVTEFQLELQPASETKRVTVDRRGATLSAIPRPWPVRLLGLGASDLIIRSASGEEFVISNAFRTRAFLRAVEGLSGSR